MTGSITIMSASERLSLSDGDKEDLADKILLRLQQIDEPAPSALQMGLYKPFRISFNDIESLKTKFEQELSTCKVQATSFAAEVTYSNGPHGKHSNWEEFRRFDMSRGDHITEVVVRLAATILPVNKPKPEKYELEIRFRTFIADTEFVMARMIGEQQMPFNMMATVEYIDYIVGKNLFAVVEGWANALPEVDRSWYSPKLRDLINGAWRGRFIRLTRLSATLLFVYQWTLDQPPSTPLDLIHLGMWTAGVFTLLGILLSILSEALNRFIKKINIISAVTITNGDNNRLEAFRRSNLGNLAKAALAVIGILAQIPIGLMSAWLAKYWFGG